MDNNGVDAKENYMIDLRPDDAINKQQAAYGDVAAASPESWSHVTSSRRRIPKDVADTISSLIVTHITKWKRKYCTKCSSVTMTI